MLENAELSDYEELHVRFGNLGIPLRAGDHILTLGSRRGTCFLSQTDVDNIACYGGSHCTFRMTCNRKGTEILYLFQMMEITS